MTQYFFPILFSLLQILFLISVGFVLRRFAKWDNNVFAQISKLVVKITLPAMFISRISSISRSDLTSGAFFPFYTFIIVGVSLLFSLLFSRLFRIPHQSRKGYLALCIFSNVGYIPLALIDIFHVTILNFGNFFNLPLPSFYIGSFLFTYSPLLWSLGNYLITDSSSCLRFKQFIPPPVIGILTGLLLCLLGTGPLIADINMPFHYLHAGVKTLGSITSPLILLVLGAMIGDLKLDHPLSKEEVIFAFSPLLIRYGLLPVTFLMLLNYIPAMKTLSPAFLLVLFIQTTVPSPANFSVMAKTAGKNEEKTALSLLVAYGTYPLILPFYMVIFFKMIGFNISG